MKVLNDQIIPRALSDKETYFLADGHSRLMTHDEIPKYKDIFDLLGPKKSLIILYVTKASPATKTTQGHIFGHWCCCYIDPYRDKTIVYYDPYGRTVDASLKYMDESAIQSGYPTDPNLTHMLQEAQERGWNVVYNDAPLQHRKASNSICGRSCALRLACKHLDGFQFAKLLNSFKPMTTDQVTAYLTARYLNF